MPALTEADVRRHLESLAKPPGSLGRLEDLAVELALAAGTLEVTTRPRRLVVFAADHGVSAEAGAGEVPGVSAWPRAVTTAMARTVHAERATCSALGRAAGCAVRLVDVGVETPLGAAGSATYAERRVVPVSADLATGPALSREQLRAAWAVGADEAEQALAAGERLLLTGELGIANTTVAACLTAVLTDADPRLVTGTGAGSTGAGLARKHEVVAGATARARPLLATDAEAAVAEVGGAEVLAMAGFCAAAAAGGGVVLLDGYVATAAALVAERLAPGTRRALVAAHRSAEPGHAVALAHLGLRPVLEWEMRLGEGTGALVALPLLDAAAALLTDVATLAEALGG